MPQPEAQPIDATPPTPRRSSSRRWWALAPLAIFVILVGVFAAQVLSGRDPAALPSVMIDRPAPAFNLPPLLDDKPGLARSDLGGKPVLVNFFASWCAPCIEEHGVLAGYAASGGVPLYGILYKDTVENGRRFLSARGDPYTRVAVDAAGRTAIDFGLYGVPETYIIDAAGRIRYRYADPITPEVLEKEILPRLAALESEK